MRLLFVVLFVLLSSYSTSHAYIRSVEPGNNDTSLIVTFSERIEGRINITGTITGTLICNNSDEVTYLFEWREKTSQEDEEWQSESKTYIYTWNSCTGYVQTETFTIKGLKPNTTYEVRYNSNAIHEGTTGGEEDEEEDEEAEDETAIETVTWGSLKSKDRRGGHSSP